MNRAVGMAQRRMAAWTGTLPARVWPHIGLAAGYIVLYLVLDRISFLEAFHGIDVTPWNPPAGLTLALLLVGGPAYMPLAAVAALLSSQVLPLVPIPPAVGLVTAVIIAGGYAAAASVLRRGFGFDPTLRRARDVTLLIAAAVFGAGLVALGFMMTYAAAGVIPWADLREAGLQFWIGDSIGIVVFTPLFLLVWQVARQHGATGLRPTSSEIAEAIIQAVAIIAALALVFGFDHDRYSFQLFYLLFLPLVWIATRHGLAGASAALFVIQAGLIASLEFVDSSVSTIRAFQLLMFAVAITGLMLGAVVSERHRVARALAESQGRLTAILNAARDGVLTINGGGRIESANPAAGELFGFPAQQLIGRDVRDLLGTSNLVQSVATNARLPQPEPLRLELEAQRADGAVFPIELTAGHFGALGDERHTLVIRDIALRRQAEARAQQHQSEIAQVSRISMAGEMASALAHEINQPLMAITTYARGCLRLLKHGLIEAGVVSEGIEQILVQAERAGDVVGHVREFVRTGGVQRALVDVAALVETTISLAAFEAAQSGIDIQLRLAAGLPAVLADRVQIEQVLLNLLRNAFDAILAGGADRRLVVIEARRETAKAVEIAVADTGPGIADEIRARLFEPFVTTKTTGMGLGLSISRSIVEAHGGHLRLRRTGASGSVLAFDLPAAGEAQARVR